MEWIKACMHTDVERIAAANQTMLPMLDPTACPAKHAMYISVLSL